MWSLCAIQRWRCSPMLPTPLSTTSRPSLVCLKLVLRYRYIGTFPLPFSLFVDWSDHIPFRSYGYPLCCLRIIHNLHMSSFHRCGIAWYVSFLLIKIIVRILIISFKGDYRGKGWTRANVILLASMAATD